MWVSHGLGPPQVKVDILKAIPTTWFFFWFRFFHETRERCARIWRGIHPTFFYDDPIPRMPRATVLIRIPIRPPPWYTIRSVGIFSMRMSLFHPVPGRPSCA